MPFPFIYFVFSLHPPLPTPSLFSLVSHPFHTHLPSSFLIPYPYSLYLPIFPFHSLPFSSLHQPNTITTISPPCFTLLPYLSLVLYFQPFIPFFFSFHSLHLTLELPSLSYTYPHHSVQPYTPFSFINPPSPSSTCRTPPWLSYGLPAGDNETSYTRSVAEEHLRYAKVIRLNNTSLELDYLEERSIRFK